jgi:hypothetical protein
MPPVAGRRNRHDPDQPWVLIQGRVRPDVRNKARAAADAAGVSFASYLERLIERDEVDETGCPVWLEPKSARDDQQELPLKTA